MITTYRQLKLKKRREVRKLIEEALENNKKSIILLEELYLKPFRQRKEIMEGYLHNEIVTEQFTKSLKAINERIKNIM